MVEKEIGHVSGGGSAGGGHDDALEKVVSASVAGIGAGVSVWQG